MLSEIDFNVFIWGYPGSSMPLFAERPAGVREWV